MRTKRDATTGSKYSEYIESVLQHITRKERAVLEPVLRKYRHVFHDDDTAEIQGTDLVEPKIITGDARPIRKAQYRVPYALRKEMEGQVRTMFLEGSDRTQFFSMEFSSDSRSEEVNRRQTEVPVMC